MKRRLFELMLVLGVPARLTHLTISSWLATSALVVTLFACFATPTYALTEQERWAALDALRVQFESLPHTDLNADNQSLLAYLQSRPEFADSGIDTVTSSVWAAFADGQEIVIANDQALPPPSSLAVTSRIPGRAKVSPKIQDANSSATSSAFRLLRTVGLGFDNPLDDIRSLLTAQNYAEVAAADTTVDSLKTVGGDVVVYFMTHGGKVTRPGSPPAFVLWTGEKADLNTDTLYFNDLFAAPITLKRTLAISGYDLITGTWKSEWRYGITAEFVRKYWSFSDNSFVYIDGCGLGADNPVPADFRNALFEKNAAIIGAWTGDTNGHQDIAISSDSARLVFDRLLGSNVFFPEDGFKQRPFYYDSVREDLPKHSNRSGPLGLWKGAALTFFGNPGIAVDYPAVLAPSISYLYMRADDVGIDRDQLAIEGLFGPDARPDAVVTVSGGPASILKWNSNEILVQLDPSSAGDVTVTIRGHSSNVARLTAWQGQFLVTDVGPGSLARQGTFNLQLRGDIRQYRQRIHDPAIEPMIGLQMEYRDATGTFQASGSASDGSTVYALSGSGPLFPYDGSSFDNVLLAELAVANSHSLSLYLAGQANQALTCTVTEEGGTLTYSTGFTADTNGFVNLTLDEVSFSIQPGNGTPATHFVDYCDPSPYTYVMTPSWGYIPAAYPPDPTSAR